MPNRISNNRQQKLFGIPSAGGWACLGHDVAYRRTAAIARELGRPDLYPVANERHTIKGGYGRYMRAVEAARISGKRLICDLTPALVGLEGRRVEVTLPDGSRERFWVGKSGGWIPVHLAVARRNSSRGTPVYFPHGARVRVVS